MSSSTEVPKALSLDELWRSAPAGEGVCRPEEIASLPESARRYLEHSIAPGTPLASAVRLRMHGEIKLKGWCPFEAEQVIRRDRGMIWQASVRMYGLAIKGSDRIVDGEGGMEWRLFGLIPFLKASGPDISRSAAGRVQAESVWLPSIFLGPDVAWTATDASRPRVRFPMQGQSPEVELAIGPDGRLQGIHMQRWGNPEGKEFHLADFGGSVEEEGTFDGYTIPTRLRIGWHPGTDRFESEGEFFRVRIDEAEFR
jgi:hypothetical protein